MRILHLPSFSNFFQFFDPVSEESGEFCVLDTSTVQMGSDDNGDITESSVALEENDNDQNEESESQSDEHVIVPLVFSDDMSRLDISLNFHDYDGKKHETVTSIRHQLVNTETTAMVNIETQTDIKSVNVSTQTECILKKTVDVGIQTTKPDLVYEDVKDNAQTLMFYTGFPNSEVFEAIFDEIKSDAPAQTGRKNATGRNRTLRLIDEFFLVLMRFATWIIAR